MQKDKNFLLVFSRLKQALRLTSDVDLASALAMSKAAFDKRKLRGSLPKQAIDNLIVERGLSPDYIYDGAGSVFVEDEHGHTWEQGFNQRLAAELGADARAWLARETHEEKTLKAVKAGNQTPSIKLLRDMCRFLKVDLNYLFTGEIIEAPSIVEEALLKLYRQSPAEVQQEVLSRLVVANSLANKSKKG
jgi:transcriptional regulator with XRE-family HTH domain